MAYHVIHVLCGGGAPAGAAVPVERLLELEREAFLSLCGEAQTQERIAHMLRTGKTVRN
jgi:3-hydroxyacyl-CoA dehydrogenase